MLWQPSLDDDYTRMDAEEAARRIGRRREQLGDALVILGHHYQADEVFRHADFTGDSLKLSQIAARVAGERDVRHVIFCGVHFMAETADMLTPEHVRVILPDLSAGCSMADMADYDDTVEAWNLLHESLRAQGWTGRIVPVTYVNSTAAIKAFVGQHGGACCTSSNADAVFEWAMRGGEEPAGPDQDIKILFLPDQHLGRNTAAKAGIDTQSATCVYDPRRTRRGEALGGATPEQLLASTVILWAGHCSVHKLFRPEHCAEIRQANRDRPDAEPMRIIVHPECAKEVVDLADESGSTEFILNTVRSSEPGSRWAVGTEHHLVNRLAAEMAPKGVEVRILSDCQCLCTTMYRIDQPHLLWVLDNLCGVRLSDGREERTEPKAVNVVSVHPEARRLALQALERMLSLSRQHQTNPVD
jgi:quinolinate synthase